MTKRKLEIKSRCKVSTAFHSLFYGLCEGLLRREEMNVFEAFSYYKRKFPSIYCALNINSSRFYDGSEEIMYFFDSDIHGGFGSASKKTMVDHLLKCCLKEILSEDFTFKNFQEEISK